ncbi:MAG TPA: biotin/lipoyl-containing protein [Candidatus Eisenbacteria bacterium]|jgi:3-methylcrotonyl-CoA carboxylase alpha subunit
MNVLLSRGGRDFEATVEAQGDGFRVTLDGTAHDLEGSMGPTLRVRIDARPVEASARREGDVVTVDMGGRSYEFRLRDARAPRLVRRPRDAAAGRGVLHAPMPGLVVEVLVQPGDSVEAGRPVVVVEAMKMQNALAAPISGRVRSVAVASGTAVETGALLLAIEPEA